jgi:hypothetical protein
MKPRLPRRAITTALLACALVPSVARADDPRILFVARDATPFSARVRAEIEAMGFTLEPADAPDADPAAVAAARVVETPPPRRVELWLVDPARGRLSLRAVIQPSTTDDDETQTVRASEQLRAFFQPLRAPAPSRPGPASPPLLAYSAPPPVPAPIPPPSEPPPAPSKPPRFVAAVALAVPVQTGGPGADLALRARWMATRILGVGAIVSLPIAVPRITSTQGSASLEASLFGAELTAVFFDAGPVRLATHAGLALGWLRATGFASAPYVGQSSSVVTSLPFVGVEIAPRLTERVRLCLDGDAAVSAPRADIAFAGHVVASWARPLGLFAAGVSVDF